MKILAIETSCDDTGVAVIEITGGKRPDFKVFSNIVSSQIEVHRKWGGVYPTLAKREHQRNLTPVLIKALKQSRLLKIFNFQFSIFNEFSISNFQKLKEILTREEYLYEQLKKFLENYQKPDIDLIAVTNGPGLEPCLWVGVNFAKALSYGWDIPIVPVNHIEAHILVNWCQTCVRDIPDTSLALFPAVCLVVSGGHTQLILMKDIGKYKILGETRDDAAGECFDKVAKILGLGYPGGPAIAKQASQWKNVRGPSSHKSEIRNRKSESDIRCLKSEIRLPRPMIETKDYDFSFSGLKTAVLYDYKKRSPKIRKSKSYIQEMCAETQQAIIDVLIKKTIKAAKDYNAKTIILGGGVSANNELRKQFISKIQDTRYKIQILFPPKNLSTDNAVMTAITGYYNQKKKTKNINKIDAEANLRIK